MKDFERDIIDNDEILKIFNEIKIGIKEDRYNNASVKDFTKDYTDEIEKIEEALLNCMSENDLTVSKTFFSDKWKILTKNKGYPYELFNSLDV